MEFEKYSFLTGPLVQIFEHPFVQSIMDWLYLVAVQAKEFILFHKGLTLFILFLFLSVILVLLFVFVVSPKIKRKRLLRDTQKEQVISPDSSKKRTSSEPIDLFRLVVLLPDVAKKITSLDRHDKIANVLLEQIKNLFPFFKEFGLFFPQGSSASDKSEFVLKYSLGINEKKSSKKFNIPFRKGLIGFCAYQSMILWSDELESRFGRQIASQDKEEGYYSPFVAIPIILNNRLLAILTLNPETETDNREMDNRILSMVSDIAAISFSYAQNILSLNATNLKLNEQAKQLAIFNQDLKIKVNDQVDKLRETEHKLIQTEQLAIFGEFVATLTHDIKNPLAFISGEAQWAKELLEEKELNIIEMQKSLEIIHKNSIRLQEDIQNLLGKLRLPKMDLETVPLSRLFNEPLSLIRRHAEKNRIKIFTKIPDEKNEIECYPALLRHAFTNILTNGLEAMKKGGTLEITVQPAQEKYQILIKDSGSGIDSEDIPHVFELFYSKRKGGTGLGLSSVRRIIERQHSGQIQVSSTLGKGTTFTIELPRKFV